MDEVIKQVCNLYYKNNIIIRSSIQELIFWQNDCFLDIFNRSVVFNVLGLHKIPYAIKRGKMWIGDKKVYDINGKKPWNALAEYQKEYTINYGNEICTLPYLLHQQKKQTIGCYENKNDKYIYMRIEQFDAAWINDMVLDNKKILVLDLRGNFGGNLSSMLHFLKGLVDGTLFYLQHKEERYAVISKEGKRDKSNKIYIIVDEETASPAEIFAFVLKEKTGAIIIGEPTYGKWIVHQIIRAGTFFVKIPQFGFVSTSGIRFKNYEGIIPDIIMDHMRINAFLQERIGKNHEQV